MMEEMANVNRSGGHDGWYWRAGVDFEYWRTEVNEPDNTTSDGI